MSQRWSDFKYVKDRDSFVDFWYDTALTTTVVGTTRDTMDSICTLDYEGGIGSIEIRYHNGTLNKTKMRAWAIFWTI